MAFCQICGCPVHGDPIRHIEKVHPYITGRDEMIEFEELVMERD